MNSDVPSGFPGSSSQGASVAAKGAELEAGEWDKKRVLVVDDDPDMRILVAALVETIWSDVKVLEFDPLDEESTPIFDWSLYDLLILDYQLGNGSGLDWLKHFSKVPEFPPTILITGVGSEDVAVKALKLGADDYVRKGEGFRERLVGAIHEIFENQKQSEEERSDWSVFLKRVGRALQDSSAEGMAAMVVVELDQFHEIRARKGLHIAAHVLDVLHRLVGDEIKSGKAKVISTLLRDEAVVALAYGLEGVTDAEAIAQQISEKVGKVRFRTGDQDMAGTASVGMCVVDSTAPEAARLVARGEAACHSAKLRGGNQAYLGSLRGEIGEAVSADTPLSGVWRKDEEVNSIITERRLRTQFEHVRRIGDTGEPLFYRVVPTIFKRDGGFLDGTEFAAFLAKQGRRTFMDRITLNQALMSLDGDTVNPEARLFMRLSGESAVIAKFWDWLQLKLENTSHRERFVFEIAYADLKERRVQGEVLERLAQATGCRFAIHGLGSARDMTEIAGALPVDFMVVDLSTRIALQNCDRVAELVAFAHAGGLRVVLNGVDDNVKFACAYNCDADLMQGNMPSQWSEVEIEGGDVGSPWG